MSSGPQQLCIAQDPEADQLLSSNPFALLVGMLLDQQFPMERAFAGPAKIRDRFGSLDPAAIAAADPADFAAICARPPAVHRYHGSMAKRVQALAASVVETYGGDAARLWETADSGGELKERLLRLPGFGAQKATIFVALLGKQLDVRPPGWQEVAGDYGQAGYRSVADVVDADSLAKVREHKQRLKRGAE